MDKIITIPFGYLLDWLYQFTGNYGLALIFFAIAVRLVLMPISAKQERLMAQLRTQEGTGLDSVANLLLLSIFQCLLCRADVRQTPRRSS